MKSIFLKSLSFALRVSLAAGVVVFISLLLKSFSYNIQMQEYWSLENQVTRLINNGAKPSLFDDSPWGGHLNDRIACVESIKKNSVIEEGKVKKILPEGIELLNNNRFPCGSIIRPTKVNIIKSKDISKASYYGVAVAMAIFTISFSLAWMRNYPHIGWRRLSMIISLAVGVSLTVLQWLQDAEIFEVFLYGIIGFMLSSYLVFGFREAYIWIIQGFDIEKKQ